MSGRPLRFLALAMGGWVTARVLLLWHETGSLPEAIRQTFPIAARRAAVAPTLVMRARPERERTPSLRSVSWPHALGIAKGHEHHVQLALLAMSSFGPVEDSGEPVPLKPVQRVGPSPTLAAPPGGRRPRRWSGSAWLMARDGVGLGADADAAQLGGSQGGVRIDYALGHGFAATGRLAFPAAGVGRELSLGVAWQPSGIPVRLVAERRFALDHGRGGPAIGVSGGLYAPLPAGFRLESYAQAGTVFRERADHYVDGIARVARPIAHGGPVELDVGVGGWGGAQRGATRLDVGPSIGVRLPIADRAVRLTLDWRQRIAGNARPGSGAALTLGSDF